MKERERKDFEQKDRSSKLTLNAVSIIEKTVLDDRLGLWSLDEREYLEIVLAWDLKRKDGYEVHYLVNHPFADAMRAKGGVFGFVCGILDRISASYNEEIDMLANMKRQAMERNPSLASVYSAIDRASNFFAIFYLEARKNRTDDDQFVSQSRSLLERSRREIEQSRQKVFKNMIVG